MYNNMMKNATKKIIDFGGNRVEVFSAKDTGTIDITPYISDPDHFYGSVNVHHVIKFGSTLKGLIGKYDGKYGDWGKSTQHDDIILLEEHYDEARKIMDDIARLANLVIANENLYNDIAFCTEYYYLAARGYELLRQHASEFGFGELLGTQVSLERGGLVSTRLALGYTDIDAKVKNEVRVVTKRTHLIGDADTNLTVTIKWRNRNQLKGLIAGQKININDFVNPASGASVDAFIIATRTLGTAPSHIHHRSISVTKQGILFTRKIMNTIGISTSFYSVGVCDELNEMYYLTGRRSVGDAGHILRHFLPHN
ncbi:MAG: hypothetical protein A2458_00065 [Candidatus Kerfeldbacteria bacterium RIFOXYC2_FULL_38_9]|uniref:Uncharacterized protein n=1 Tax=Candidatus Kerfeldbacteria bacterium RIFOXYB2_FULL_38_14 TaxID=1798547 RepID=A0A1G2BHJ1_9BACT|nr:MAG: hypothetical protein A2319_04545 [Candidatus Kerfeldbacteria bacterium RIFOXYB2_FULL_38_14]OGY90022.1 MAG: hypothetical protein A2458_00065 [Candidatus Kerfeldbacteria bacterium RIFOXYC2_FULL_38_9]